MTTLDVRIAKRSTAARYLRSSISQTTTALLHEHHLALNTLKESAMTDSAPPCSSGNLTLPCPAVKWW